jgi:hypothetical protein
LEGDSVSAEAPVEPIRAIDNSFLPTEVLYRRFAPEDFTDEFRAARRMPLSAIAFPDFSVNREKYCTAPEDVLVPNWQGWGIASFTVADVPSSKESDSVRFEWRVEDAPYEGIAHAEVRTYRDQVRLAPRKMGNKAVKLWFRQTLADRALVCRVPGD